MKPRTESIKSVESNIAPQKKKKKSICLNYKTIFSLIKSCNFNLQNSIWKISYTFYSVIKLNKFITYYAIYNVSIL